MGCIGDGMIDADDADEEVALVPEGAGWGGRRTGAGRKRSRRPRVPHETRSPFDAQWPVLVTWRMLPWLPSLRTETIRALWRKVIAPRPKFQVLDWSLQVDHLHFIAEAADDGAMERAMIGLGTSFSRRLNRLIGRIGGGRVFDHRYHRSALTTPQAVERAIRYVHDNWKKHGLAPRETKEHDPYSSAAEHARVMRRARTWIGRRLAALHL